MAAALAAAVLAGPGPPAEGQFWPPSQPTPATAVPSPTPVPPGAVRVEVTLLRGRERIPGEDSVAWVPGLRATAESARRLTIAQREKQFEPRVAITPVGSTVDFPNYDRVFHNVFSLSQPKSFDLGLYRRGKSKAVLFDRPGLVQVYCNIHPHMAAYLMVVDSSRHGAAGDDGRITLVNLPPGRTRIGGWNVRGGMWSDEVVVRPGQISTLDIQLDITSWRDTPHLNKHGKEYPSPDDDDFRY